MTRTTAALLMALTLPGAARAQSAKEQLLKSAHIEDETAVPRGPAVALDLKDTEKTGAAAPGKTPESGDLEFDFSGKNGKDGARDHWDGENGQDGAWVDVRLRADTARTVLKLEITAGPERKSRWLALPLSRKIVVRANGGNGGRGYDCRKYDPDPAPVRSGGNGGLAGAAGHVSVAVSDYRLWSLVETESRGGDGARGGRGCSYEPDGFPGESSPSSPASYGQLENPLTAAEAAEGRRALGLIP